MDGNGSLYLQSPTIANSAYWQQSVAVEPGKTYFVQVRFRNQGGHMLLWMHGSHGKYKFDQRAYLLQGQPGFLEPVFLKPPADQPDSDTWQILARSITIPQGLDRITFGIGSYFNTGTMWYDDIQLIEGIPPLELHVQGDKDIAHIGVAMRETGDGIFHANLAPGTREFTTVVPDAVADQPYIITVRYVDGTAGTKFYPVKDQETNRN